MHWPVLCFNGLLQSSFLDHLEEVLEEVKQGCMKLIPYDADCERFLDLSSRVPDTPSGLGRQREYLLCASLWPERFDDAVWMSSIFCEGIHQANLMGRKMDTSAEVFWQCSLTMSDLMR